MLSTVFNAIKEGNSRANAIVMLKKADLFVISSLGGDYGRNSEATCN